ncbi:MAG: hypothetical protein U0804_21510 [Gemmataceae bacterium]
MPPRPLARPFRVEPLEDRVTPTVTTDFTGGTLTVTLGDAGDAATVTGTGAGADLSVAGTGLAATPFSGVTALVVVDGGGNGNQSVTFDDAAAGTGINLAGAISVNGVESVRVATLNGDLRALSFGVENALAGVTLVAGVTTTGDAGQLYRAPVTIGDPLVPTVTGVTLDAGSAGGVEFAQTVNGATTDAYSLTVNAGSATKPTQFGGQVGGTARLTTLTTDAAGFTLFAANVTTRDGQTYNDPVRVGGTSAVPVSTVIFSSTAGGVSFLGTLDTAATAASPVGVVVNAALLTRFAAEVGGVSRLNFLTTDAGAGSSTEIGGNVTTTGNQTYGDAVTVAGAAVTLFSSANGAISFNSTLSGAVADTTALTVNTGGQTSFADDVGGTRLLSLTTDAAGSTTVGAGGPLVLVTTAGGQTFNDAVTVNGDAVRFESTNAGDVKFASALNGASAGASALTVTTAGTTTFGLGAGATTRLLSLTTDPLGTTVLGGSVTTNGTQFYGDPVTVTPGTGVTTVTLSNTAAAGGPIQFGGTITGASAVPVVIQAAGNVVLGGAVTLSAAGSAFTVQAGTSATGQVQFTTPNTLVRADSQTYRAGNGPGGLTTATVNLRATTPQLRNAGGTAAPVAFVMRQDESITDASLPAASQFGGTFPRSVSLVSDDGSLTLASTSIAGAQTTDVLLSADGAVTLNTAVSAPTGTVRLNSVTGAVTQGAAGTISAAALGVRAATGVTLNAAPNAVGLVAIRSAAGVLAYATATSVTVGTVAADPRTGLFSLTSGLQTTGAAVDVSAAGSGALDLTISGPVAGSAATATGGGGDDRVTVNYSLGGSLPNGLTFTGAGGTDTLALADVGATAAHTYTVNGTVVRDSAPAITLSGVEAVSLTGGDAADTFAVTPDANYTVAVAAGNPITAAGDSLTVNLAGTTAPVLTTTKTASGLQGSAAFGNRQSVTFSGVESLTPSADVRVSMSGPTDVRSGETGTYTVTVINAGPAAVTGVPLTDVIPTGLSATWTATATAGSSVAATSGSGDVGTTADIAVGGTVTITLKLTVSGSARGTVTNTFTAGSAATVFELDPSNNAASTTITTGTTDVFAVGAGPGGGPVVVAYNPDGTERFRRFAFDTAYSGGVTVATGDITGDGVEDVVAGSAAGASRVTAFDGRTGAELATFFAFPGFTGGVNVAVAGGKIVAGAGVGGGPVVALFTLGTGGVTEVARFLAFGADFRGGVQVGGSEELLVVGAGPGGGPHVKVFDAATLAERSSFFAFPVGSTDGVTVAVGGSAAAPTILVGSGIGSVPVAVTIDANTLQQVGSFQAFESTFRGGVRVAAGGIVNGKQTTVVAPGGGGSSRVRILAVDNTPVSDFFAFESAFTGGVYVG